MEDEIFLNTNLSTNLHTCTIKLKQLDTTRFMLVIPMCKNCSNTSPSHALLKTIITFTNHSPRQTYVPHIELRLLEM